MILCVCLSPALDVTYELPRLVVGGTNRVRAVRTHPGGKAVNVARVLHQLGEPALVVAPVGGPIGDEFAAALAATGVPARLVPDDAPTRRTVTIVDDAGTVTLLNEPARLADWPPLLAAATAAMADADVVVLSGRQPDGAPPDAFAALVAAAHAAGRPVVLDTSGPALAAAVRARPTIVKPNADELAELGVDVRQLAAESGAGVVASLGADGVFAILDGVEHRVVPPTTLDGNPTGAGDALVAGLALGLREQRPAPDLLHRAVALGAAAVPCPHAGEVDLDLYEKLLI